MLLHIMLFIMAFTGAAKEAVPLTTNCVNRVIMSSILVAPRIHIDSVVPIWEFTREIISASDFPM